jgi:hypothetical protein
MLNIQDQSATVPKQEQGCLACYVVKNIFILVKKFVKSKVRPRTGHEIAEEK